ncbi:unnamed protein product [Paramecium octaurelia]|uniref:PARP catalytic domain-containing protein n=1 Tax=Paramecium octaurelia TaxID=43137 RepID=A0A8S1Y730_PAROT|nr:unnamed protein product [Paramecium octaurelia]
MYFLFCLGGFIFSVIFIAIVRFIYQRIQNLRRQRLHEELVEIDSDENNLEQVEIKIEEKTLRSEDRMIRGLKEREEEQERKRLKEERRKQEEQLVKQDLYPISQQTQLQQEIITKPVQQQIQILNQEIKKINNNNDLTNNKKQYYKHQYQQQLITKLKQQGEVKSIPHVKQNIQVTNPELALFVLKESLLRDQNIDLLTTSQEYSFGFDSIIGSYGSDQSCLKVRNTNLDSDKIVNDNQLLQHHLLEFKQQLSSSLNISIDQIEILGISKKHFEINFNIKGNDMESVQQQINNNPNAKRFLNEYCDGKIEYVAYFDQARVDAYNLATDTKQGITLSSDDFNPSHNRNWDGFKEKEQRGPAYHRYDYYFPRGCYGFGLNVKKYRNDDWIKMDGNPNEWRIMYHGTKNLAVNSIVKNNLQPGQVNQHANDQCLDEFNKIVRVGCGIYFSNKVDVCINDRYGNHIDVGNKKIAVVFMSRVNPKKIRQSDKMKELDYFVINNSEDVRPYRILLHEKK